MTWCVRGKITTPVEVLVTACRDCRCAGPIIQPANDQNRIAGCKSAGVSMHSRNVVPSGTRIVAGDFNRAGNRQHFVRERPAVVRGGDVDEGLHVVDDDADVDRNGRRAESICR